MDKDSRILIVGHHDIIEKSLISFFQKNEFPHVFSSSQQALDVLDQQAVREFFDSKRIDYVFLASTRSGGIAANQAHPGEFIYHNLESQNHIIDYAYRAGVKKLMFFSGSCAYPKETQQPIKEESLLTGPLETTSESYSVAKIAGIKMCQGYRKEYGFNAIVAVPATVYGPGAEMDPPTAHVISALIVKFHEAVTKKDKTITVWGTGDPRREFLFSDDFVSACIFLMENYDEREPINVGCGEDVSIKELAQIIKEISGFKGDLLFDSSKPDGTMRKLMDNTRITKMGWKPKTSLKEGIRKTYDWYCQ